MVLALKCDNLLILHQRKLYIFEWFIFHCFLMFYKNKRLINDKEKDILIDNKIGI